VVGRRSTTDGGRTVGGVLLAAGQSTRFGNENKLLVAVDGRPIVHRAAGSLLGADLSAVVAVLGHRPAAVAAALDGLDVATVRNEAYARGQSTSVARGVAVARERDWDAAVFGLGDMPFVASRTVARLVEAYREGTGTVLAPAYDGRRGNPVLFDRRHFEGLAAVTGDRGGRDLIEDLGTLVDVDDPGIHRDVDEPSDLP